MYILCGEAMVSSGAGQILEASCLQAEIVKKSEHSECFKFPQACYDQISLPELQNGVQVMIFVAFIIVALVIIYAILYQVIIPPKKVPVAERIRSSTCFRFARKSGWQATLQGTMREDDLG